MPVRPLRTAVLVALPAVIMTGVGVAAAAGPSGTAAAPAASTPAYVGSAYGIRAQLSLAGGTLLDQLLPEVVKFPSGGDKSVLELPTELSETATLKVLNANSAVKNNVLRSNARTAGLSVLTDLVTAAVLNADCTAEGLKVSGDAQVTDLRIAGIKVPIDPGPNFKVEIPQELEPFLSGGIWVDRQDTLKDGTLRVRALQVRLVIDPLGLQAALDSLVATVRAAAEQVVAVVEEVTGETLGQIVARERAARGAVAPVVPATDASRTARNGRASERGDIRAEYAAHQKRAEQARAAQARQDAAARDQQARAAEAGAVEAEQRAAEARAAAEAAGTPAGTAETPAGRAAKTDRADVTRDAGAEGEQTAAADVGVESKRDRSQPGAAAGETAPQHADAGAEDAGADAAAAEAAAAEAAAAQTEAQQARERASAARAAADAAQTRADAAAASAPAGNVDRADATPARQGAAPVAPAAEPPADEEVGGTLGVDVIVSQVTCKGAKVVKPAAVPEPDEPADEREALPRTGGNGNAVDLGVAGLGLLLAGSAAVCLTRRRGRHAR